MPFSNIRCYFRDLITHSPKQLNQVKWVAGIGEILSSREGIWKLNMFSCVDRVYEASSLYQKLESGLQGESGLAAEVAERLCDGLQSRSMEVRILPSAPKVNEDTSGTA